MPTRYTDQATPQAGARKDPQHSSAPQEAYHGTESQHAEQARQWYTPEGQQSLRGRTSHSQDQLQDVLRSHSHTQSLSDGAVMTPDHQALQLSAVPHLAPNLGLPLPEFQPQAETLLTQEDPKLNQSSSSQHATAVLYSTPVLAVSRSNSLSTRSFATPKLHTQLGSGTAPSLAAGEQQHGFSAVPTDTANEAPEAELSPMQRALRALSSKGIQ